MAVYYRSIFGEIVPQCETRAKEMRSMFGGFWVANNGPHAWEGMSHHGKEVSAMTRRSRVAHCATRVQGYSEVTGH